MSHRLTAFILSWASSSALVFAADSSPVGAPALVRDYCLDCHGAAVKKGGLDLEALDAARPEAAAELWEKVVRKLHHRQMPPQG
ncbi:MAG: hypothetical protein EBR18_08125, partial [Betaproteobacteria bacterium]|nr:hypothetical protein [Betaproteobacteria bacterium]